MNEFYTAQKANEGVKVPLRLPSGEPTKHWLRIRSMHSKAFRMAEAGLRALMMSELAKDSKATSAEIMEGQRSRLSAALVSDWSLDKPESYTPEEAAKAAEPERQFTEDNVVAFLEKAPQVAALIDQLSGRTALFSDALPNDTGTSPRQL